MGIKYSTGRGTRVKHSTALEWEDLEKQKKKYDPIKHSTGEDAQIRHATGTEFDYKALYQREQEDKEKREEYEKELKELHEKHFGRGAKAKKLDPDDKDFAVRLWDGTTVKGIRAKNRLGLMSRVRSKPPAEGDEYVEKYYETLYQELVDRRRRKKYIKTST